MAGELKVSILFQAIDKLTAPMRQLIGTLDGVGTAGDDAGDSLHDMGTAGEKAGDKVADGLSGAEKESGTLNKSLAANEGLLRRMARLKMPDFGFGKIHEAAGAVGGAFGKVGDRLKGLLAVGGALGLSFGGAIAAFKNQFLDPAANMERLRAVLETIEGSSDKAGKSLDWVSSFAAKTPYELNQVSEAFVSLRAYGMEPTNGLLETLGDTASAMGKPLSQAIEAMADAVTGENERLKEFGIRASSEGDKLVYTYTQNGKTMTASANKNSREQIQAVLTGIFNSKYAGAMKKQSQTWDGMISNLSDQWTRFKLLIMNAGLFEWMKGRLGELLSTIDAMAADGSLQELAAAWGEKIKNGILEAWEALKKLWEYAQDAYAGLSVFADMVGGWENVFLLVAAAIAGPALWSVVALTGALWGLATAFLATPLGWITAGILVLVGIFYGLWKVLQIAGEGLAQLAFLIYDNWDGIVAWFSDIGGKLKTVFDETITFWTDKFKEFIGWFREKLDALGGMAPKWLTSLGGKVIDFFKGDDEEAPAHSRGALPQSPLLAGAGGMNQTNSYSFSINGAGDPSAVAKQVRQELDRRDRENARKGRTALHDGAN